MKSSYFISKYGEWALITGASDGIGRELAFVLAKRGLNLILCARRKEILNDIAKDIQIIFKVKVEVISVDLSDDVALSEMIYKTGNKNIGLLVTAAGFGTSGYFSDLDIENELNMVDLNCRSVVSLTHFFANKFKKENKGGIILFSSLVAFQGTPFSATYSATKSFIQNFGEGIGSELSKFNVDVLVVAPGPVATGFGNRANMLMGRALQPKEIGEEIISSLGKRRTVRPGFLSKFLEFALRSLLFRNARVFMMKIIMGGMTKHQRIIPKL